MNLTLLRDASAVSHHGVAAAEINSNHNFACVWHSKRPEGLS